MRIGGLFEGYGGLTMAALAVLGGDLAWYSEMDPCPCKVLAHHHPGVPNLGDITAIDWATVEPVEVLAGGFPCQDISNAGRQAGIGGERSGLWKRMVDAIRILRPGIVVVENVGALLVRGFDTVAADLAACGYDFAWQCVRASDVGAPHRRERLFILAWPALENSHFEAGGERWPATSRQAEGWRARADTGGRGRVPAADTIGDAIREQPVPVTGCGGTAVDGWDRSGVTSDAAGSGSQDGREGRPGRSTVVTAHTDCDGRQGIPERDSRTIGPALESPFGDDPDGRGMATGVDWGQYGPAIRRWESLTRPAPLPWQISKRTGNRQLSARFTEWCMGLPDGYVTDHLERNAALHVLGNGVVPQQGEAAIRILLERAFGQAAA